uniref:Uncharacterized protein n=1 Tax=Chromera velia CCMP2878 TaxID=1169474 RepID=A0A0G4IAJ1_9ALVE|eukprot:Cvel_12577.t1-p1 / transcript=Cvel_12577.t1 / gene=Cvel_12577 / organism=Chromera_velia_CCMP2878 / gene_product=hypothetical protein / transcript_product=hypothetical protein / location=Cvel_scaffold828:45978-46292(+) / protein_length=105 / sequence_SO=supercontig / SO=protein_coding / is_pseudo=false
MFGAFLPAYVALTAEKQFRPPPHIEETVKAQYCEKMLHNLAGGAGKVTLTPATMMTMILGRTARKVLIVDADQEKVEAHLKENPNFKLRVQKRNNADKTPTTRRL